MNSIPAALEDNDWKKDAHAKILMWAASGLVFSADDLRQSFRPAPHGSMVGQAFRSARLAGKIKTNGFKESRTPSRKAAVIRTWTGIVEGVTK